jgi:anti-anti-sigma factor
MSSDASTHRAEVEELQSDAVGLLHVAVVVDGGGREIVLHVTGEIDLSTCGRLRDAIEPHLGPRKQVILELSGVRFMDSSCLGILEHARTSLTADGGSLVLRNPSRVAHRLLTLTGLTKLMAIEIG